MNSEAPHSSPCQAGSSRSSLLWLGFVLLTSPITVWGAREPWTASTVRGSPEPPAPFRLERVFTNLNFAGPVDFQAVPGEPRFLLLQQDGKLFSFDADPAARETHVALDIRAHHKRLDNALGFTVHPKFQENRFIFINYNEPGGTTNGAYVSRFTVERKERPTVDWSTRTTLLTFLSGGHNGCQLIFGPDNYLYISIGDASPPDPPDIFRTGQGVDDFLSCVLRLDVDRPQNGRAYGIPSDNPFVDLAGARPEIFAFGFRNPWRMSFAPDGALWVGDVGWELWELLHRVTPGYNGGWAFVEGPNTSVRNDVTAGPTPVRKPLVAIPHSDAASITGGRFYRGARLPELKGAYVFGDYETGKFWSVRSEGEHVTSFVELCDTTTRPVAFAEDAAGELLILDHNGGLYQLERNEAPDQSAKFPRRLSESGLFRDTAGQQPTAGVFEYQINTPMWADHATARRWVALPGTESAQWSEKWSYPTNTVFAKTLSIRMDSRKATSERRIETQLLHFDGQTWRAYSYRWNDSQTDAELVGAEGLTQPMTIQDPEAAGGRRVQNWRFHSRTECLRCHNPWAGNALAFGLEQLNRSFTLEGGARPGSSQLAYLETEGYIRVTARPNPLPRLANLSDSTISESSRARSWLHVNCAHCHRANAGGSVATYLNHEVDAIGTRTVDVRPIRGGFGLDEARVVAHGEPSRSSLFYRINTEGQGHMPHIGSRMVDEAGVRLVASWIRQLKASTNAPDAEAQTASARVAAHRQLARSILTNDPTSAQKLDELLKTTTGGLAFLEAVGLESNSGRLPASAILAGSQSANPLVRDLFDRFLPADQRRRTLGEGFDPQRVLALTGDTTRGKRLFHAEGGVSCNRCHTLSGMGRAYGPDLTSIAKKYPLKDLLDQIIHPTLVVPPEFTLRQFEMNDGSVHSGFVVRPTAEGVVLRGEDLTDRTVRRADVQSETTSAVSAMPEGLLNDLTAQEAADLLSYLLNP